MTEHSGNRAPATPQAEPGTPPDADRQAYVAHANLSQFNPDEVAPVDWQADPAHWLPGRSLWIVAAVVAVLTIATIVTCLLIWSTPAMQPVKVPTVAKA